MGAPNVLMTNATVVANAPGATATVNGPDLFIPNTKGLTLVVVTANRASTGTFTPVLQMKLPAIATLQQAAYADPRKAYADSSTYVTLWTAAAAIAANGTVVYQLAQNGVSAASGITESKQLMLPAALRFSFTYGGAGAFDLTAYAFTHPG